MNRNEVRDALYPNCPIRNVLSRVGDKWSMLVLFTLENNDCQRFKELQRNIPDISQKDAVLQRWRCGGWWTYSSGSLSRDTSPRWIFAYGEREKSTAAYRQPPFMGEWEHGRYYRVEKTVSFKVGFLEVLEVNSSTVSNPLCKYFSSTRFLLRLNCIRINAFLACKRCSLRPLLTPFWSPIKHLWKQFCNSL